MKKRFILGAVAVFALASAGVVTAGALKSGLPVGDHPTPFHPLNLTGSSAGKKNCLV
jgi:hypothetical protein